MTAYRLLVAAALSASLLAPACAPEVEPGESATQGVTTDAQAQTVNAKTKSFSGTLAVKYDGTTVKFAFDLSHVDWTAQTAVWTAKVTDDGGADGASDDPPLPMRIHLMRCPGCFDFVSDDEQTPISIRFRNGSLSALTYAGIEASSFAVETVSNTSEAP